MTDDGFEEFLQREARGYNAPPPTPREEMWARIDAERRTRRAGREVTIARRRVWWTVGAGIAAALVLGVGIGYVWRERVQPVRVAQEPNPVSPATGVTTPSTPSVIAPGAANTPPASGAGRDATPSPREERAAYAAMTVEHLSRAEALLTSFRVESEHGTVDPQVTAWAGDLLGTTRLLLDSPGARDPRLHKLLGDLELVLTQIAQLHAGQGGPKNATHDELQLIDQSLRSRDMLTRIRSATPAGGGARGALSTGT